MGGHDSSFYGNGRRPYCKSYGVCAEKNNFLGANASMELCKTSEEYSVTLPITAIHSEKDKYFVYTMEKADTVLGGAYVAKKTNVTIAEKMENMRQLKMAICHREML